MKDKAIYLTEEEQVYLKEITRKGVHNVHEINRARVLLMLDRTGKSDHVRYKRTAEAVGLSVQAVYNMRDGFFENHDIESYLTRKKRETGPRKRKLNGEQEARIIAPACSEPLLCLQSLWVSGEKPAHCRAELQLPLDPD